MNPTVYICTVSGRVDLISTDDVESISTSSDEAELYCEEEENNVPIRSEVSELTHYFRTEVII